MGITEFGGEEVVVAKEEPKVDLEKIRNKKGQVGAIVNRRCDACDG